ncbi:hypothetical protein LTR94_028924, partial [Friedmanniomyces endolithicus]
FETVGAVPVDPPGAGDMAAVQGDDDAALAADDQVTLPVQIGGKRRGEVVLPRGSDNATVEAAALANPTVQAYLAANNLSVRKVIVVPDRIVNLVAG